MRLALLTSGMLQAAQAQAQAQAQAKAKIDERLNAAASVIEEVMAAPDHAIP